MGKSKVSSGGFGDIEILGAKLNDQKKLKLFSDLHILISSGIDLNSVVSLLKEESESKAEIKAFTAIDEQIKKGKSLSESMELSGLFSKYEYHTIKIGEQTGRLDVVLKELSDFYEERVRLKRMVIRALSYPAIVLFMAMAIFYFMLQVVIPIFSDFFAQHNKELPGFTQKVISISNNIDTYLLIILIVIVGAVGLHQMLKNVTAYRRTTSQIVLSIPFVGKLIKEIHLSRFCQSMGFLTESKVNVIESLELVSNTVEFYPIQSKIEQIKKDVIAGDTLHAAIAKHKIFGNRLPALVKFGEHSNQMGKLFSELGKQYAANIEHRTKIISNVVEPVLIVLIAGAVGVIMMAIYMPMSEMGDVVE